MEDNVRQEVLREIRNEQHPIEDDETLLGYIKDAEYDINKNSGKKIDYGKDLDARKLLKYYVLYDRNKRLAEFKALYVGEYSDLQAKYYTDSSV